jgi:hypothetical protein
MPEKKEKKVKLVDVSIGHKRPVLDRDTEFVSWHGEAKKVRKVFDGVEEAPDNEIAVICQDKKKELFTILI